MSSKHKSHSLDKECLCSKCPLRFFCFTQERVFSDPLYQGLFEALMAKGRSREEAIDEVTNEIKNKIAGGFHITLDDIQPTVQPNITIQPYTYPQWETYSCDNVNIEPLENGSVQVSYTLLDGEEVSWNAR
uniref:Uncharacterized protein n=1 Tax=viral metagenome TaxID=1070528 RepID=A0A6M3LBA6_9ZZZZ